MRVFLSTKKAGWLASGVVITYLQFDIFASLVGSGRVSSGYLTFATSIAVSCALGGILCARSSARDACVMGIVISSYLPFLLGMLWLIAGLQDVFRGQGLPGDSLSVMHRLPSIGMLIGFMAVSGVAVTISGLASRWVVRRIRKPLEDDAPH